MKKTFISRIFATLMVCVLAINSNVVAFAAEVTRPEAAEATPGAVTAVLLTSGHFSNYQGSSGDFYVSGGVVKAFYLTLTGDPNSYVNFTVYRGAGSSNPVWGGSFKADGEMHQKNFAVLTSGNYHIDFNTASSSTIIYAMSWNG